MKVQDLADKLRTLVGDNSIDISEPFILNSLNWAFNDLPLVPKLDKLFSKHYHSNLNAKGHYRWKLNRDFRRITNIPMINFYTSTGGEPCHLKVCYKDPETFYAINGIVSLKRAGTPCTYTIEYDGDDIFLVFDRPLDIPMILDYIVWGNPQPVTSMEDEIEVSAIAEPLILSLMQTILFRETDDFAWSGNISDMISNDLIPRAIQQLYKNWGGNGPLVMGEN